MENEGELNKYQAQAKDTDSGFSEAKSAKRVDLGVASKSIFRGGNLFTGQQTSKTVFQAQKSSEK